MKGSSDRRPTNCWKASRLRCPRRRPRPPSSPRVPGPSWRSPGAAWPALWPCQRRCSRRWLVALPSDSPATLRRRGRWPLGRTTFAPWLSRSSSEGCCPLPAVLRLLAVGAPGLSPSRPSPTSQPLAPCPRVLCRAATGSACQGRHAHRQRRRSQPAPRRHGRAGPRGHGWGHAVASAAAFVRALHQPLGVPIGSHFRSRRHHARRRPQVSRVLPTLRCRRTPPRLRSLPPPQGRAGLRPRLLQSCSP